MNDDLWLVNHNQWETFDELIASNGISHQYWTAEYKIVTIYNKLEVCVWLNIYISISKNEI